MRWLPLVALLALASCGEEPETAAAPARAAIVEGCPATPVPDPPFVAPDPYPPAAPPLYGRSWYGSERLWTWLPADGTWPMAYDRGTYYDKSFWWPGGEDARLRVTGRRLDAPAPHVDITASTNGSRYDLGEFMLVMLELPERGCWEITGHHRGERLSFVVRVTRG